MTDLPDFLYHATPLDNAQTIREIGLMPSMTNSSQMAIYLSDDAFTAENYACMRPDDDHLLIRIDTRHLDIEKLGPDDYEARDLLDDLPEGHPLSGKEWHELTWPQSLSLCNQITYADVISPAAITFLRSFRVDGWPAREIELEGGPHEPSGPTGP